MTKFLLIIAFLATIFAAASFATGFDQDFRTGAVVAVVALGGVFLVEGRHA